MAVTIRAISRGLFIPSRKSAHATFLRKLGMKSVLAPGRSTGIICGRSETCTLDAALNSSCCHEPKPAEPMQIATDEAFRIASLRTFCHDCPGIKFHLSNHTCTPASPSARARFSTDSVSGRE